MQLESQPPVSQVVAKSRRLQECHDDQQRQQGDRQQVIAHLHCAGFRSGLAHDQSTSAMIAM